MIRRKTACIPSFIVAIFPKGLKNLFYLEEFTNYTGSRYLGSTVFYIKFFYCNAQNSLLIHNLGRSAYINLILWHKNLHVGCGLIKLRLTYKITKFLEICLSDLRIKEPI